MAHPHSAVAGALLALVLGSLAGCAEPVAPQDPDRDALFAVQLVREANETGTQSGHLVLVDETGASSTLATGDGPAGAPLSTPGGLTVALAGHDEVLVDGAWESGPQRTRMEAETWATSVGGRAVRVLGGSSRTGPGLDGPMTLSVWDGDPARDPREVELPEWAWTGGVCGETVHLVLEPARGPSRLASVDLSGDGALRVRDVGPLRGAVLGMTGLHGLGCVDGDPVVVTRGPAERGGAERTHVVRIDARTAELSPLPASRDLADLEETWSLAGQVGDTGVLTTGHDRDVLTVDLRTGEVGTLLRDPPGEHQRVTVRGDRALVLGQLEGGGFRAVVLDVANGKRLHEVDVDPGDFQDPEEGLTDVAGVALLEEG